MIGKRISMLRKENGLSQAELANSIGISRSSLSLYEIEKREPDSEIMSRIADFFNVSTDYIYGRTDTPIANNEFEWRYPLASNRFGNILSKYRRSKGLSCHELAEKLDISDELEQNLESGIYQPSMNILKKLSTITQYDIDYLTGVSDSTRVKGHITLEGREFDAYYIEGNTHFKSRLEELCLRHKVSKDNSEELLGISSTNFFDLQWNRMPTLSELLRLSYFFNVSIDYLIGKTDTPFSTLSNDEISLILNYRDCIEPYKQNIRERAEKLSIESLGTSDSVDTDVPIHSYFISPAFSV